MSKQRTQKPAEGAVTAKLGPHIESVRKAAKVSGLTPSSFMRIVLIDAAKKVNSGEIKIAVAEPKLVINKLQTA